MAVSEEFLLASHNAAHDLHKFYTSFRFKIVAFLATANGALFYFWVEQKSGFVSLVITVAGIIACCSLLLLDRRNRQLFDICLRVASAVEAFLNPGIRNDTEGDFGIYGQISRRPRNRFGHGRVIQYVAILGMLGWSFLLLVTALKVQNLR